MDKLFGIQVRFAIGTIREALGKRRANSPAPPLAGHQLSCVKTRVAELLRERRERKAGPRRGDR